MQGSLANESCTNSRSTIKIKQQPHENAKRIWFTVWEQKYLCCTLLYKGTADVET